MIGGTELSCDGPVTWLEVKSQHKLEGSVSQKSFLRKVPLLFLGTEVGNLQCRFPRKLVVGLTHMTRSRENAGKLLRKAVCVNGASVACSCVLRVYFSLQNC